MGWHVAISAHKIARTVYHLLKDKTPYTIWGQKNTSSNFGNGNSLTCARKPRNSVTSSLQRKPKSAVSGIVLAWSARFFEVTSRACPTAQPAMET
jgi:hypothetical protein